MYIGQFWWGDYDTGILFSFAHFFIVRMMYSTWGFPVLRRICRTSLNVSLRKDKEKTVTSHFIIMQPQNASKKVALQWGNIGIKQWGKLLKNNPSSSNGFSYSNELESFLRVLAQKRYTMVWASWLTPSLLLYGLSLYNSLVFFYLC